MKTGKMVLLAALVLFFGAYSAPAATIIVNPGDSIQNAINAAPNGSTIKIKTGTYIEEITITGRSRLKLIGAGAGKTIIDGTGGAGSVVTIIDSKKIILQQCTITNGVSSNVAIGNSHRVKILRNEITTATNYGIAVGAGTKLLIQGNQIKGNGIGIGVVGYHNLIVKNTITGNGSGIWDLGNNDKIIKNTVRNNTDYGITITGFGPVIVQLNTVTDNGGVGILEELGSAHQNVYMKNTVQRNAVGISVGVGAMVIKNTVTDNTEDGIDGTGAGNTVISNIIKDNAGHGIYLVADGHYLKGNLVDGNGKDGIYIDASKGGTITVTGMSQILKNKVLNNGWSGIYLDSCVLSIVSNNFCNNNSIAAPAFGISGGSGSMGVIYTKNKVNNTAGGLQTATNGVADYIARNIVANNFFFGVDANGGHFMTFEKNVIIGNGTGLSGFDIFLVSRNKITNNAGNGIDASSGGSSLIRKNIVKGNGDGTTTFDLYDSPSPTDDWWQKNQYLTESL